MLSRILIPTMLILSGCAGVSNVKDSVDPTLAVANDMSPVEDIPYFHIPDDELNSALPDWAVAELKRESDASEQLILVLGDEHRFSLLGNLDNKPEWNDENGYWYFEVNYQGESPLECFVFNQDEEPMSRLASLHDTVLKWYKPETTTVDSRIIVRSGLHVQNDSPVAGLDYFLGMTDEAGESTIGLSQGYASYKQDHVLSCVGITFGYRETIARIFNELVDSWELRDADLAQPYYRELYVMKLENYSVGFADISFEKDSDGDTAIRSLMSVMVKTDDQSVTTSDESRLEYSTPEGFLINAYATSVENGELTQSVAISPGDNDEWFVEGSMQGKSIDYTIKSAALPTSMLGDYQAVRNLIEDTQLSTIESVTWIESLDPSTFTTTTTNIKKRETDKNLVETITGPLKVDAIVNDAASAISMRTQMGGIPIGFALKSSTGSFE